MQASDYERFADAWALAWETCGRAISPGAIELAFEALRPHDLGAITAALTAHVRDPEVGQFPPKPADVVRHIEGAPEQRAALAWAKLRQAVRRVGPYRSVAFDDAIIHAVIRDLGGWAASGEWRTEELPFREQDFRRAYRAYASRGGLAYPPYLLGISQIHNEAGGHDLEPPMLVGDPDKAAAVIAGGKRQSLVHNPDRRVAQMALDIRRQIPRAAPRIALAGARR